MPEISRSVSNSVGYLTEKRVGRLEGYSVGIICGERSKEVSSLPGGGIPRCKNVQLQMKAVNGEYY